MSATDESTTQFTDETPTNYVLYNEYDNAKLIPPPKAEKKTVPGTGPNAKPPCPEQNYHQIVLKYDYGSDGLRNIDELCIEGPEMKTTTGIMSKLGQSGNMEYTLPCRLDLNNPEHTEYIEMTKQLYAGCAFILEHFKIQVNMKHFQAANAEATGLPFKFIYFPMNKDTLEILEGQNPSIFFKLFKRGNKQTLFTKPDGEPVDWDKLEDVEMKFIPLIHVKRIYISGTKSIQIELQSAIITDIQKNGTSTKQTATLNRLRHHNPDVIDRVNAQFSKLNVEKTVNVLNMANMPNLNSDKNTSVPTFNGISGNNGGSQMPSSPPQTGLNIPGIPSMPDFTANAPSRTN